ncbi:MAG TPA: phosphoglycerate kinase, partial [Blastocatellia bacterium]|nr:phosphoglycerate kinase [Blastocatellia bacterium]
DTLAYLMEAGARVVVAAHLGSYEPGANPLRLDGLAAQLSARLGRPVALLEGWDKDEMLRAVNRLHDGELLVLENLSREPGEETNAPEFAELLAGLCDIHCNDAFTLAHELRASTVGVARRIRRSVAGRAFDHELAMFRQTLDDPARPVLTILGGRLSEEKLAMVEVIARRSDVLLLGGELCLPFLIAQGHDAGGAEVTGEMVMLAERILSAARRGKREIDTPLDFMTIRKAELERMKQGGRFALGPEVSNTPAREVRHDRVICDIGETTRWAWSGRFGFARTIFWHGPVGLCEYEPFAEGTRFLANELVNRTWPGMHRAIIAGGSLTAAIRKMKLATKDNHHLSLAGKPALHYFAGRSLPAVDALCQSAMSTGEPPRVLIPLGSPDSDVSALRVAAELGKGGAEIYLLHVQPGFDEERHADIAKVKSEAERLEKRMQITSARLRRGGFLRQPMQSWRGRGWPRITNSWPGAVRLRRS